MSTTPSATVNKIPFSRRCLLILAGCLLTGMLVLARWLDPSPTGFGTHQQLGFSPCTFVRLFDQVCPACGMTTSWTLVTRGRMTDAVATNLGGTLLSLAAMIAVPWLFVSAGRGRWLLATPSEKGSLIFIASIALVTILDWAYRLYVTA